MSVTQVGDLIRLVLQELEVLSAGDDPSSEDYSDGVDWLNVMLGNWSADESLQPNLTSGSFSTVAGTASYTAGSAGTAFATRPIRVVNAYVRWQGVDSPLAVKGKADYNQIQNKAQTGPLCALYYVPSYPLGTIYFDRVPDQAYEVFCSLQSPIGEYADENATLVMGPELKAAVIYNLCIPLSSVFKANLKPSTVAMAKRTLERIQYQSHVALAIDSMPTSDLVV